MTIVELAPDGTELVVRGGLGWPDTWRELPVPLGSGTAELALAPLLAEAGARNGVLVPMLVGERALGFVGVHDVRERAYSDVDVSFVRAVGNVVAGALERLRIEGDIAHDFNSLLGVILNFSEFVAAELPAGSRALSDLDQIRNAARSAGELTQRLLGA